MIRQPATWTAGRKENADAVVADLLAKGFVGRVDSVALPAGPGHILSEADNGRTALILEGAGARVRVDEIATRTQATGHDGASQVVDGINRVPGRNVGCGGVGDDRRRNAAGELAAEPRPVRDILCLDPDEIVVFRPEWGAATPSQPTGDSVDVLMDGNWVVTGLRSPAGGPVPAGGRVLQGIGAGAQWLRAHSESNKAFKPGTTITDSRGAVVSGSALSAVAGGGPALVRDGEIMSNADANGTFDPDTNVVTSGIAQRHPRTLAGVTATGELLLVTIDGRLPQTSVGVTVPEAAAVLKWLGARDALSLGSGGDTKLLVKGTLYNRPMDSRQAAAPTECRVGNAVVVVPR
ncbi:phosphodiester glycosidase family protein [Streptomyces sp. NPDC048659]|uniref:phosphodiester glycosidase family protein n=1 Tax=Streptomyces sp. NPDC048659 TaxID=3155489 RepID=UPI003442E788